MDKKNAEQSIRTVRARKSAIWLLVAEGLFLLGWALTQGRWAVAFMVLGLACLILLFTMLMETY